MALMIILLPVIAVVSLLWGNDSRETMRSKEQELTSYGMRWPHTTTYEHELAEELAAALEKQHDAPTKRAA